MARFVHQFVSSRYFIPAFNSAIFDGSLRVYFAQSQEAFALSFYHNLKADIKWSFKSPDLDYVLILVYPQEDWVNTEWGLQGKTWSIEQQEDDVIVALSAAHLDSSEERQLHLSLQRQLAATKETVVQLKTSLKRSVAV